jgi:hypothetical protein
MRGKQLAQHGVHWTGGESARFTGSFPWPSPPGQAGFEFFLLPSRIHARPHATNANRWAAMKLSRH